MICVACYERGNLYSWIKGQNVGVYIKSPSAASGLRSLPRVMWCVMMIIKRSVR